MLDGWRYNPRQPQFSSHCWQTPVVRVGGVWLRIPGLSISIDPARISRCGDEEPDGNFRNQIARFRWNE